MDETRKKVVGIILALGGTTMSLLAFLVLPFYAFGTQVRFTALQVGTQPGGIWIWFLLLMLLALLALSASLLRGYYLQLYEKPSSTPAQREQTSLNSISIFGVLGLLGHLAMLLAQILNYTMPLNVGFWISLLGFLFILSGGLASLFSYRQQQTTQVAHAHHHHHEEEEEGTPGFVPLESIHVHRHESEH